MHYPDENFTQTTVSTKINDREYSAYMFSVRGSKNFQAMCKRMFLDNLEAAGDVDVSEVMTATEAAGFFQSISKVVKKTDFDEFFEWHLDCIESCYDVTDKANTSRVNADDLMLPYNYELFGWFLVVQLRPFMHLVPDWVKKATLKMKTMAKTEMATLLEDEPKSSQGAPQT